MNYYKYIIFSVGLFFSSTLLGNVSVNAELADKIGSNFNLYLYSTSGENINNTIAISLKLHSFQKKSKSKASLKEFEKELFSHGFLYSLTSYPSHFLFDIQIPASQLSEFESVLANSQSNFESIIKDKGWIDLSMLGNLNSQRTLGFFHANWQAAKRNSNDTQLNINAYKQTQYANLNVDESAYYDLLAYFAYCANVEELTKLVQVDLEVAYCFSNKHNTDFNDADLAVYKTKLYEQLLVDQSDNQAYLNSLSMFITSENRNVLSRFINWLPNASLEKLSQSYNRISTSQNAQLDPMKTVPIALTNTHSSVTNKLDYALSSSDSEVQTLVLAVNNLERGCQTSSCQKVLESNHVSFIQGNPSFFIAKFSSLNNQKLQKDFIDNLLSEVFSLNSALSSQDIKLILDNSNPQISNYLNNYFDTSLKPQRSFSKNKKLSKSLLVINQDQVASLDWANDFLTRYWLGYELQFSCPEARVHSKILGDFSINFLSASTEKKQKCFNALMTFKDKLTKEKFAQSLKAAHVFLDSQSENYVLNLILRDYYQLAKGTEVLKKQLSQLSFQEYQPYIEALIHDTKKRLAKP